MPRFLKMKGAIFWLLKLLKVLTFLKTADIILPYRNKQRKEFVESVIFLHLTQYLILEKVTIIDYNGAVHYDTIGELIHQFKSHVPILGIQIGTYKKVLLVMIESLENIMKYRECPAKTDPDDLTYKSLFSIIKEKDKYYVNSCNTIEFNKMESLEKRLVYLNNLSPLGIKEYYKETITNGQFSQMGGAGLGLIEMAKISGNKIEYMFQRIDDNYVNFSLRITVDEFPTYPQNITASKTEER